ncbi:Protein CBG13656 [Caenorhabditis briggsae]|uniref:Uncharacterized protein n=2 Tax=Caenorhabditis briggsae TaxID=6238 RepID=A0AAE9A7M5_CAEBR|nr:Protein CBG13656 [Caenorhabditis briggsae]ULT93146.1 hypothetical protein L3Y34_002967 [Caenorhabditis briggsae]UMM26398.1 hypothetical protein L5515_010121 [Caenorhabditis briggsae]CAP32423.2 Protein CBG13656 [Caenorhabditis briggsae]
MDPHETSKAIQDVVNSIKICSLDYELINYHVISQYKAEWTGLGQLTKNIMMSPGVDPKSPVLQSLKDLKQEIKEMGKKMHTHLNNLKAALEPLDYDNIPWYMDDSRRCFDACNVVRTFYQEICVKSSVLYKTMADVIYPQHHDTKQVKIQIFRDNYNRTPPLELALKEMMDSNVSNPIQRITEAKIMNGERLDAWKKLIDSVFTKLLIIECFASGLLHETNPYRRDTIDLEIQKYLRGD